MVNQGITLHFDVLRDPKALMLGREALGNYVFLLGLQNEGTLEQSLPPCVSIDSYVARRLGLSEDQVLDTKAQLLQMGLISDAWMPLGWSGAQPIQFNARNANAERRKERERLKKQKQRAQARPLDVPPLSPLVPSMSPPLVPTCPPDVPASHARDTAHASAHAITRALGINNYNYNNNIINNNNNNINTKKKGVQGEKTKKPAKPASRSRKVAELTFPQWLNADEARRSLPEDDSIFERMKPLGINDADWVYAAWVKFDERFCDNHDKKYKDWRATFRNYVENNWLKLWDFNENGEVFLTYGGLTAVANIKNNREHSKSEDDAPAPKNAITNAIPTNSNNPPPDDLRNIRLNIYNSISCFEKYGNTVSQFNSKKQKINHAVKDTPDLFSAEKDLLDWGATDNGAKTLSSSENLNFQNIRTLEAA